MNGTCVDIDVCSCDDGFYGRKCLINTLKVGDFLIVVGSIFLFILGLVCFCFICLACLSVFGVIGNGVFGLFKEGDQKYTEMVDTDLEIYNELNDY